MATETWNEIVTRMSRVTDKLGKPIDEGIFETVVALNALGVQTTQSCEGHLLWGIAAPWVDIDPPGNIKELRNQMRIAQKDEAREISDQLKHQQCVLFHSLSTLLAQFYRHSSLSGGSIEYDRILLARTGAAGRIRLEPIGVEMQTVVPEDIKAQKLLEYQQEMKDFTTFMKRAINAHP